MKHKRIAALSMIVPFLFLAACAGTSSSTTQTDIQNAAQVVGTLAKAYSISPGPDAGLVGIAASSLCLLTSGPDSTNATALSADIQAILQKIWTSANGANTTAGNLIALAINTLWSYLGTAVSNAGSTTPQALVYLEAAVNGFCMGFQGSL